MTGLCEIDESLPLPEGLYVSYPFDAAMRSLDKKEATGLRKLFMDTMEEAPIITNSGIYVEEGVRFEADMNRIYSVVRRIVRGLHYAKTGVPIPVEQTVKVGDDESLEQANPVVREQMLASLRPYLQGEPEVFGKETFLFFWIGKEGNPLVSHWFLVFFSRVIFYGVTAPAQAGSSLGPLLQN